MSTVASRPAEWIIQFLTNNGGCRVARDADGSLNLQRLNVKELKAIAKEIHNQIFLASIQNPTTTPIYSKPSSTARKAEWVSSIVNALAYNDVLDVVAPRSATVDASRKSPRRAASRQSESMRERAAAAAEARSPRIAASPRRSAYNSKRDGDSIQSTSVAAASSAAASSATLSKRRKTPSKRESIKRSSSSKKANKTMVESDAAMARRLQQEYNQQQYFNETISAFSDEQASIPTAAGSSYQNPFDVHSKQHSSKNNSSHKSSYKSKRAPHNSPKKSHIKVKPEPKSPTKDDSTQPRDYKESSMVQSLRTMGFTDMREMLSGIRATSSSNDAIFIPNQWNQQQHVEAAMMWIVNQREEEAEARKLDEARVSSEMADRAIEKSRREENERQMKIASLDTLFGTIDGECVTSRYFPQSVLLKNVEVRRVLHSIGNGPGKDVGIKLLQLEAKARKWYGTVLPYSHFKHVLCPCFETWSNEFIVSSKILNSVSSSVLVQKVSNETKELERGMYNLSNQEQGSFGMAPKLFLEAQRNADAKGLPTSEESIVGDGDVTFVPSVPARCSSSHYSGNTKNSSVEVIEIV